MVEFAERGVFVAKKPGLGERACPKCKETIKVDAAICKHCHSEFSPEEIAAAKMEARKSTRFTAFGCLGLVLFVGFCGMVLDNGSSPASIPEQPGASAKHDVTGFYRKVMDTIRPCDNAGARVADAGKAGDVIALYQAADAMEATCLSTSSNIAAIDVPSSIGREAHAKLTDTRKACENAYLQRWVSAGTMKKALDERGSVGRLAELKDAAQAVQAGTMICAAGLVGEALALGATEADLGMQK